MNNRLTLITGSSGFLGGEVANQARALEHPVLCPTHHELDLEQQVQVQDYICYHQPTHILHVAAACGGIQANIDRPAEFLSRNAVMGLNILQAAVQAGVTHIVLVSTTCAYPETAPVPLKEEDLWNGLPTSATRAYGLAKRFLHEAFLQFSAQYGVKSATLIPANLYGEGDHYGLRSHVVAAMIKRYVSAARNESEAVTNWGDGSATREFLHVSDAARAVLLASDQEWPLGPINVGTGEETSIRELSDMICEIAGYQGRVEWDVTKPTGQPRRCLDTSLARSLGYSSRVSLRAGLEAAIRDYIKNH